MGESFEKDELISYRMERARETLRDARLLFEQGGSYASIINRAYYAMFYCVLALLITVDKGASKHSGVIAMFDEYFAKKGKFSKDISKALHRAFDLRQIGDYRELLEMDGEQAGEILFSAKEFMLSVEQYLAESK